AKYLNFPPKKEIFFFFITLLTCSPHTPILFYYVFIMIALLFWGNIGLGYLFLSEKPHKLWYFIIGVFCFFLLLGSYPPILSLILTLFVGKKIQQYLYNNQNLKEIIYSALYLFIQLIIAAIFYKLTIKYLEHLRLVNPRMYNISIRDPSDLFHQLFIETFAPIYHIPQIKNYQGFLYTLFYTMVLFTGTFRILYLAKNKFLAALMVISLFLSSRIPFILSASAYYGTFRVSWWGEIGLIAVNLSFLIQINKKYSKNLILILGCFFAYHFILTNYEIQKTQWFIFSSERLFQKRTEESLFSHPDFNLDNNYMSMNFGYPDFSHHFCYKKCPNFNNELLSPTSLPSDFGQIIFWDEIKNPLVAKYGIFGKNLWFVTDRYLKNTKIANIEENTQNLRYWMYLTAREYPHYDGIYVDDKLIVFNFDTSFFNQYRELVVNRLIPLTNRKRSQQ
ncbi:MAG: hypothetical protein J6W96_02390, partial [Alphaproteobacteria bacterium]|nr:hypothetical protein [Alphaproteobacteria bacterium]